MDQRIILKEIKVSLVLVVRKINNSINLVYTPAHERSVPLLNQKSSDSVHSPPINPPTAIVSGENVHAMHVREGTDLSWAYSINNT